MGVSERCAALGGVKVGAFCCVQRAALAYGLTCVCGMKHAFVATAARFYDAYSARCQSRFKRRMVGVRQGDQIEGLNTPECWNAVIDIGTPSVDAANLIAGLNDGGVASEAGMVERGHDLRGGLAEGWNWR